ncbi:hypothetical protein C2S53_009175 [Perilla frutescens var. hirtella]|uniref:non-specific serine/threonine protein kinase n=1 Tax=Perilla frutescens var. hirtella TaxID=608512 RepID=A0AAD4PC91_PERFH|nr:hypothetical protein C2S53_009175 [Perilla frutescens var. hirtella]
MGKPAFLHIAVLAVILLDFFVVWCSGNTALSLSTDEEALVAFKSRISSDPYQILAKNWSTTNSSTSICSWFGVSCGAKRRVTALRLFNLSLGGTVAPHLGNLSSLRSLDLGNNRFTGHLPRELAKLHHLENLGLDFNNLSGDVPVWLGALTKLEYATLQSNSFTGAIPNLFNLSKLEIFDMSYNSIHGNIPRDIGNLSTLKSLDLKYNQLTGSIPSPIFNISSLEMLDLSANSLSGSIPMEMCDDLPRLEGLFLSQNHLSGSIPSNLYKCRSLQRLSLSRNQFNGSIPREIGELTILKNLYLGINNLEGGIPPEIGNLSRLEIFSMRQSSLTGKIPSFIFNMSSLKEIDLGNNSLSGSLPLKNNLPNLEQIFLDSNQLTGESLSSLIHCNNVRLLQLSENHLTGAIPKNVGNMSQLEFLFLNENKMTGQIPSELGNLNLKRLTLSDNGFSGSVPLSIFNISTMVELNLANNQLSGQLPATMGSSLVNLELLYLTNNSFAGVLPSYINNASKLCIIDLGTNTFTGLVPDFGNLRLLKILLFPSNNLRGESPNQELRFLYSLQNCQYMEKLDFSLNQLNGNLPHSIGNLSPSLQYLRAFGCSIKGSIPAGLGNLSSLTAIVLDSNELTGVIPTEIGKMKNLEVIYFEYNRLEGQIPAHICQISRLGDLYLSSNMLKGAIPSCLGKMKSLQRVFLDSNRLTSELPNLWDLTDLWGLNLSNNMLTGQIQPEIKNMKLLRDLDLSWNQFSGDIPSSIGNTESLETLSLAHNSLQGGIPWSLGNLRGLESLNLSNNNFSGLIPRSLEELRYLKYFDVSHNRLEGEIPTAGCFANFSAQSFMQNDALCGVSRFQVPSCKVQKNTRSSSKHVLLIKYVMVPVMSAIVALVIALWLTRRREANKRHPPEVPTLSAWRRVSYQELLQATENFSEVNLLGSGSFGSVFKGTLSDGLNVAVKVFNIHLENAIRSFDVECEIISNVRHRNLVRVISCCSNVDFKALVLEYMPNGSLEKWLYSHTYCLDLQQILNIAIDVAVALEYLHHGSTNPIVHCDLKPSNVLLDEDMTAHVADFGISKLFEEGEVISQTITLATIGYMAPEYGSEGKVSTNGDVYSYGIMLLEMFTKKKPIDDMFNEEISLKEWVSQALQENAGIEVVAPGLLPKEDQHISAKEQCISSIFRLAMQCLTFSPGERSNMIEMVASLKKIRDQFLASTTRHRQAGTSRMHQEVTRN